MNVLASVLSEQSAYFSGIDALLPAETEPPHGEVITARTEGGGRVAGILTRTIYEPGEMPSLWSAREVWQLHPLVGAAGGEGIASLLDRLPAWQARVAPRPTHPADSAWTVLWPSRDTRATRVLLDHGFMPLSVLAVRTEHEHEVTDDSTAPVRKVASTGQVRIRRAVGADLDAAVRLTMAELEYSAQVGGTVVRPDAETMKRKALRYRLDGAAPVWLAESAGGQAVGLAECRLIDVPPVGAGDGGPTAERAAAGYPVPPGRWGYVNCVSVLGDSRGGGIGRQLMTVAHRELVCRGARGSYLYYNPANPLSSVFWPRRGYRPLWTVWEVRPAGALR